MESSLLFKACSLSVVLKRFNCLTLIGQNLDLEGVD
jgi:hypothetical protein